MTHAVPYSYLIGWAVASIGLALTVRRESRPVAVVLVGGAVWPLLLLGAAQLAGVALVAEVGSNRWIRRQVRDIDSELVKLLDDWQESAA